MPRSAHGAIAGADDSGWLSAATAWEIAIEWSLGRLDLPGPVGDIVPAALADGDFTPLSISVVHALGVTDLPHHNGDPFDRILIAQAMAESPTVVTAEPVVAHDLVSVLPA